MQEPSDIPLNSEIDIAIHKLRDKVFGEGSDLNWCGCRDNWLRYDSVAWLRLHAERELMPWPIPPKP